MDYGKSNITMLNALYLYTLGLRMDLYHRRHPIPSRNPSSGSSNAQQGELQTYAMARNVDDVGGYDNPPDRQYFYSYLVTSN